MKKIILLASVILAAGLTAQEKNNVLNYEFDSGLNFNFKDNYNFNLGGYIQPLYTYEKTDGSKATNELNVNHAAISLSGEAKKEKVGFYLLADFSLSAPLLDAYIYYKPSEHLIISAGQKLTPTNNREMTLYEDRLTFPDRSALSTSFSGSGREFGAFAEGRIGNGDFKVVPQVAVTSGDGRNSFGSNGRDADSGGLKYGGRLDVYPFGFFTDQKHLTVADLYHEQTFKMVLGGAFSYNKGVSNSVGEGHGSFLLYDLDKNSNYPDYRKISADVLMKYSGFSVLGEYSQATARNLDGTYTDAAATMMLQPQQISSYLMLGQAYNMQIGYVTKSGYGLDARYTIIDPEFADYNGNLLNKMNGYSFGFTKYFVGNGLKMHLGYSNFDLGNDIKRQQANLMLQVIF